MNIAIYVIIPILIVWLAIFWGAKLALLLPNIDKVFDQKPFNCCPCLTFHLIWIISSIFGCALNNILFFILGFIVAFLVFIIIRYIDNQKIIK